MKILVINCGSSSLKFQLIEQKKEQKLLAKGMIDGIGLKTCGFSFSYGKTKTHLPAKIRNHKKAIKLALEKLLESNVINEYAEIDKVGHRVVHGGKKYKKPTKINEKVLNEIKELSHLAPLHNPHNIEGIKACMRILPNTKQIAVFDTSFHSTMPEKAFRYAIPNKLYKENSIRRYGFHGQSHKYVIKQALKTLKNENAKVISCHLGNGSSLTAYQNGVIDTSMGLTPMEGVMMGTRSGSIDPGILIHMQTHLKLSAKKTDHLLNYESGLQAISEASSDMRVIFEKSKKGNKKALFAIEMLAYQLAKLIGGYTAALNGVDALIFTGGIGENAYYIREKTLKYLEFLGLKIDKKMNRASKNTIHEKDSKVKVFVTPTNEAAQIAEDIKKI